jgi:hypothetical protein
LEALNFAKAEHFTQLANNVWKLSFTVTLPKESHDGDPNPALLADFLCMFVDSIEVIKPRVVRSEIISRAGRLAALYSSDSAVDKHHILRNSNSRRSKR